MTGVCRECGGLTTFRHSRGTKLTDVSCRCGGELVSTVRLAKVLARIRHAPRISTWVIYDMSPAERAALARKLP